MKTRHESLLKIEGNVTFWEINLYFYGNEIVRY